MDANRKHNLLDQINKSSITHSSGMVVATSVKMFPLVSWAPIPMEWHQKDQQS